MKDLVSNMTEDDAKLWKLEQFAFFSSLIGSCGTFLINKPLTVSPVNFALISTGIGCKPMASSSQPTIRNTCTN